MPPQAADFLTHRESGRMPDADPCLRSGLSVFGQRPDAVHQAQLFPRLGRHIAVANLRPEHGFTRLTRGKFPSHSTWWVHVGVDRASLFSSSGEVR